jgi:hypothetical protein
MLPVGSRSRTTPTRSRGCRCGGPPVTALINDYITGYVGAIGELAGHDDKRRLANLNAFAEPGAAQSSVLKPR